MSNHTGVEERDPTHQLDPIGHDRALRDLVLGRHAFAAGGALPNLVIIGAMKCGTTALHRYLGYHPDIAMSGPKELNYFFGPERGTVDPDREPHPYGEPLAWARGNWHRGTAWYARHFDPTAAVRGEASPGYTSPAHPDVAARMADEIPAARLVYLVRDPVERALSQYRHHLREGVESREPESALLDPDSQYIARGRYFERLTPFLRHYDARGIAVVALEELRTHRERTLRELCRFIGVDADSYPWSSLDATALPAGNVPTREPVALRRRLVEALSDDADRIRAFAGRVFPGWSL